jgi:hypothetical protein
MADYAVKKVMSGEALMGSKGPKGRPHIVDPGHQPKIFATGVVAVDRAIDYVQITFCQDQMWGSFGVQEREIQGRLILTRAGFEELLEALRCAGQALLPLQ